MAREDILVDSTYGELVTADNPAGRVIYDFVLLEEVAGMDNEHYAYGEISLAQERRGATTRAAVSMCGFPIRPFTCLCAFASTLRRREAGSTIW